MSLQFEEINNPVATDAGRVLMISGSFPPMPCGVGDSVHELAMSLARKGVDITVLADRSAKAASAGEGSVPVLAEIDNWGFRGLKKIVSIVEGFNPDILHIHYPSKAYGKGLAMPFVPMLLRTRRSPFKIILTLHEFRLSHAARRMASFILLDPCDAVCMPCPLELNALIRAHISVSEKITATIPVGPIGPSPDDIPQAVRSGLRDKVRSELGFTDDDVVMIHYGTPTKSKGLEVLFKAMRLLKLEGEVPKLLIVGECSAKDEEFRRKLMGQPGGLRVKDQVHWLGRVPEDKLAGIFSAADIGVFPFLDGFSFRRSSLVGILMWDIPIVTTEPDGELDDIIGQDKVRFVARNNQKALATGLMPLVANRKALELAKSVPNPLKELFRWDRIAEQYIDIYRTVRSGKKSPDAGDSELKSEEWKIAIVHDWLTALGGAERCLRVFSELWPDAPIYATVYNEKRFRDWFPPERVHTSYIQKLPRSLKLYRHYLPLMPRAVEAYDLSEFDVVLSSSHCAAGGCRPRKGAVHVSYCYTPMRYVWDLRDTYASGMHPITRAVFLSQTGWLRRWDVERSKRVTHFVPISEAIQERIKRIYGRDGRVIYPPVRDKLFQPVADSEKGDYYLILSRLVGYKRLDIAVEACTRLKKRLIVAGDGGEIEKLKAIAGPSVEFIGFVDEERVPELVAKARALLHPSLEDFGIVPCEAACAGTPTIAYGVGGAAETVVDGKTGVLFMEQTSDAMVEAIKKFEKLSFDTGSLRAQGVKFGENRFRSEILDAVNGAIEGRW